MSINIDYNKNNIVVVTRLGWTKILGEVLNQGTSQGDRQTRFWVWVISGFLLFTINTFIRTTRQVCPINTEDTIVWYCIDATWQN